MRLDPNTIATYDRSAKKMMKYYWDQNPRTEDIERIFSLHAKQNPRVLEIGCAYGRDAEIIANHAGSYLGIDASASMIDLARKRLPELDFRICAAEDYPFDEPLDIVIAFASLLHTKPEDLQEILHRAHRALSEEGVVYLSLKEGEGMFNQEDQFGTRRFYLYTHQHIIDLAGDGYEVVYSQCKEHRGQKWLNIALKTIR